MVLVSLITLAAARALADVSASPSEGLRWRSADGDWSAHAGGAFGGHALWQTPGHAPHSALGVDLAAPLVELHFRDRWRARLVGDLEGTKTSGNLYEASLAYRPDPRLRLSAGLMPLPLGFEAAIPPEALSFFGYAFARYTAYHSDWALRAEGELGDGVFGLDVAYGFGDGFDANGSPRRDPSLQVRAQLRPLRGWFGPDPSWLEAVAAGFFVGGGYAHAFDHEGELVVRSPVGTRLFDAPRFDADSSRFYTVYAGFEVGPVRAYYEGTQGGYSGARTPTGRRDLDDQTDAWQTTVAWMITGEPYDGRFLAEPPVRGPGAWELAGRYANGDIDRDFISFGLTSPAASSQEFRALTLALSWYVTANLRLSAEYVRVQADDDIASLDGDSEDHAGLVYVQYRF